MQAGLLPYYFLQQLGLDPVRDLAVCSFYDERQGGRGALEFDCQAAAVLCKVPALQLAASPPRTLPQSITERLQNLVNGCTVGAGHFNQLEVPDQVNAMIEAVLRHYV